MLTRRHLLAAMASAPLLSERTASGVRFLEEPHSLAAESARGYRLIEIQSGWIIAPAIQEMTPETCANLLSSVRSGDSLLLESGLCFASPEHAKRQLEILRQGFGLEIQPPLQVDSYVSYSWPRQKLVRAFQTATPVVCDLREVIASVHGLPICMKRTMGKGQIVYIGSMLGPGLMAEERESHAIGHALLSYI